MATYAESPALEMARLRGLPEQMAYTVAQTSRYTGMAQSQIRSEIAAGRLGALLPYGRERGAVIPVTEVDRWIGEYTRPIRQDGGAD